MHHSHCDQLRRIAHFSIKQKLMQFRIDEPMSSYVEKIFFFWSDKLPYHTPGLTDEPSTFFLYKKYIP